MIVAALLALLLLVALFYIVQQRQRLAQLRRNQPKATAPQTLGAQLAQSRQTAPHFEALAEGISDPILLISARNRILYANRIARNLWPPQESLSSLIEVTRAFELDDFASEVLRGRSELPREITINSRLFRVSGVRVTREDGTTGALLILRDISELQRLGRARRDFVANISHELRTPLTAIRLLADTLKARYPNDNADAQKLLDQVIGQTDTLTQLTQELYDLTQIESGNVPMRMTSVPLRELADGVIARLSPQAERAGLELKNEIPSDLRALIDAAQIARVLSNLLHNAIKFTPKGTITITAQREPSPTPVDGPIVDGNLAPEDLPPDYITLSVRDTGTGIPREELPRIFERFYKIDRARGQGGTGLGLAIAKHIVEAHGCRIWAESVLGRGTIFHFTVPAEEN